ncbi:MAG: thiamine pyrophosphate-dependent dehydrogenase E1 component subunit alpha [Nitrososphaerales archaeon]|jgi:pyruvate dehydrogenase E1 component alpha subunit|nr:thiamine pyrophosphate-dependent dehydrogenase E1 component subunit alpha [Nitrososphaerales archaeon]|tara:strand:+ start:12987 stop:13976 length:990 start_codon:yes stop_codon:yes gene_type:complete
MTERTVHLSLNQLQAMYKSMLRIRLFEEKVGDLVRKNEIICPCHLYIGQEAIATGVCAALRTDDYVFSTHRSHGHYIAKGCNLDALMAELYGKVTGCSKGRGGSMHLSFPEMGFIGSSAIVAGSIPLAVGAALSFSIRKTDNVSVAFFGDGATNEGVWYESLNFAALKKLPIVFVCENNLYSTHVHISDHLADTDIRKKAEIFRIPGIQVDGNDVTEVFKVAKKAVDTARQGEGPTLIECMTYRWRGHVGPNDDLNTGLRSKEELAFWKEKGPIKRLEKKLLDNNFLSKSEMLSIRSEIEKEVDESLKFAKNSPFPQEESLLDYVFKVS